MINKTANESANDITLFRQQRFRQIGVYTRSIDIVACSIHFIITLDQRSTLGLINYIHWKLGSFPQFFAILSHRDIRSVSVFCQCRSVSVFFMSLNLKPPERGQLPGKKRKSKRTAEDIKKQKLQYEKDGRKYGFREEWKGKFPWVEFDKESAEMYCGVCSNFPDLADM